MDRGAALNWIKIHQAGVHDEDRGATRAARLAGAAVRPARKSKPLTPPAASAAAPLVSAEDEAARLALAWSYRLHARIAASVLEAGGSIEVAYAAAHIAHGSTVTNLALVLAYLGHPAFQDDEPDLGLRELGCAEPDWDRLAQRGGLTFDEARCKAYLDGLPIYQPFAEPPHTFETELTVTDLVAGTRFGEP